MWRVLQLVRQLVAGVGALQGAHVWVMQTAFAVGMVWWVLVANLGEGIVEGESGFVIDGAWGLVMVIALDETLAHERQVPQCGGSVR